VVGPLGRGCSVVELADGSLLAAAGDHTRTSADGGLTWSEPAPFPDGVIGNSLLRLRSGAIALTGGDALFLRSDQLWLSVDEGKTWQSRGPIPLKGFPYPCTMVQLESGRLIFPSRTSYANTNHPDLLMDEVASYGTWRGHRTLVSGHYHWPEIDIAFISYSDDEGRTWQQCEDPLMGWFDRDGAPNGLGGLTPCDEPSVAEARDGRLVFMARSVVGRLVASTSTDGGLTWSAVLPTDLPSSYSPPHLVRIPQTGDLLCVWNQVSRGEIRRGYRRGRLSVALSRDCGLSWENFRTLEVSAGLEDVDRIRPEYPISPVVALPNLGCLPEDFAVFRYAVLNFARDKVFMLYVREWFEPAGAGSRKFESEDAYEIVQGREQVLRIYPLDYFYGGG